MRRSLIFLAITILNSTLSFPQTKMTAKEAFDYIVRVNNIDLNQSLGYQGLVGSGASYQWTDFYASYFDSENYNRSINDEFKRVPYLTKIYNEMNTGRNNVNFNKLFFVETEQEVKTYDHNCGCFPISISRYQLETNVTFRLLDIKKVGKTELHFGNSMLTFNIGRIFNLYDYELLLKMNSINAEKFINSRKDYTGNINRKIKMRLVYSVVNSSFVANNKNYYLGIYLHRIEYYNGNSLIGTSYPKYNFYDKVNLIKIRDGIDTLYYDNKDQRLYSENGLLNYYQVVTYKNARMDGPLQEYYKNWSLRTTGQVSNGIRYGLFTWFYDNGQVFAVSKYNNGIMDSAYTTWHSNGVKKTEETYTNGLKEGVAIEWHPNGTKKYESFYKNDKLEGCRFEWDENGRCKTNMYWGKNGTYHENNKETINSSKCPCESQLKTESNNSALKPSPFSDDANLD